MKQYLRDLILESVKEKFSVEPGANGVPFFDVAYPKANFGDYATNVAMVLAKSLGKNPKELAEVIAEVVKVQDGSKYIEKVEVVGGFINFYLRSEVWFKKVLEEVETLGADYGKSREKPETIMVEYLSPNTNKPLHLGHLRNGVTGVSIINIFKSLGHKVIKVEIINDRGVHICKAMLAWQRWGEGATPKSTGMKPDHFVGEWYVRFSKEAEANPNLEKEAQEMLQKWEAGDTEVREVWSKMRQWVMDGWQQTENTLGFTFDKIYFESDVYLEGKDIVKNGLEKEVFRKNEKGNVVFDLSEEEFGTNENGEKRLITVLRSDGTSLYTTQDLSLAVRRVEEFDLDRLIYVVGSEQKFHFESIFAMLKALGYEWAKKLHHLWYGMVYLPDGKMKSREGTVVDADDLISHMQNLAKDEIKNRDENGEVSGDELIRRSEIIALAAIKFYLLKQKQTVDIHFNPKESLSFEGFTGPYCQYTYARAKSILRQIGVVPQTSGVNYGLLGDDSERQLLRQLEAFSEAIRKASFDYNPSLVAVHVFETAQAFNSFYTTHSVMKAESTELKLARIKVVEAASSVIKNGLNILGIETLEEM